MEPFVDLIASLRELAALGGVSAVLEEVLEQADGTGGWSEYYYGKRPAGTRYRPWESGINLEAVLEYSMLP